MTKKNFATAIVLFVWFGVVGGCTWYSFSQNVSVYDTAMPILSIAITVSTVMSAAVISAIRGDKTESGED